MELSDLRHKGMWMVNTGEDNIGINMSWPNNIFEVP